MKKQVRLSIPATKALHKLGQDIRDARRRRRITAELMAARADVSRATIGKIEKGDPTTSMGAYTSVLFVLGMIERLHDLVDARHDMTGRQLDEERLPQRVRWSNSKKSRSSHE